VLGCVEHVQLSLRQPVRVTFKLLLQRKDDVRGVDDVLIAHERLNGSGSSNLGARVEESCTDYPRPWFGQMSIVV
jgi:hypothetical protein